MVRTGLAGLLIGALLLAAIIVGNDGDPTVLIAVGEESPSREYIEEQIGREVSLRPSVGHDGKFFFVQALDPLYLGDTSNARYLDFELFRGQRMFFPLLIGLGGLAPAAMIPWLMAVTYVLSYGLGTAAAARLAEQQGGNPWWGLAFPLNVALIMSFSIGGAGVLALACALAGTAALVDRRVKTAAVLLALSVLSREVMLLFAAGVVFYEWWRIRRPPLLLGGTPVLAYMAWYGYILLRLDHDVLFESNGGITAPFRGLASAASTWGDDPTSVFIAIISVVICVLLVRQMFRTPSALLAGTVGFTVLAALLSDLVWNNWFDISRALAPIYTTFILITFAKPDDEEATIGHDTETDTDAEVRPSPSALAGAHESRL